MRFGRTRNSLRRSAIPGAHTAAWPGARKGMSGRGYRPELWAAEMSPLLSRPGGERRDESRLYAGNIPCGGISTAG